MQGKIDVNQLGKAWRAGAILLAGLLAFGGCSAGAGGLQADPSASAGVENMESKVAETVENIVQKDEDRLAEEMDYVRENFTKEDYLRLAEKYAGLGLVRMQRDTLEQGYRLFPAPEFLDKLQNIYVNLEEEDEVIAGEAATMFQNLELEEYLGESIHLAEEELWFERMMPKLSEGVRNYVQSGVGSKQMVITVGYDKEGVPYTHAWFYEKPDQVLYMSYSNQLAQIMETGIADGAYDGAFTIWTMNGYNGNITQETGTYVKGTLSEEGHAVKLHQGKAKGDVFDLWNNKEEVKYIDLTGEDIESRSKLAEVVSAPEFQVYAPARLDALPTEAPQVRVFDGQLQYLSAKGWINMGSVEAYENADPFNAYAEEKKLADSKIPAEREKEPELKASNDKGKSTSQTTTTKSSTPTTTKQPTSTPAQVAPAVSQPQPAPQPEPQPAPVDDDDDDDDDDSGNDGGNDGGDSGAGDDGGNDGGNDGGDSGAGDGGGSSDDGDNDAEIGWGEDLL